MVILIHQGSVHLPPSHHIIISAIVLQSTQTRSEEDDEIMLLKKFRGFTRASNSMTTTHLPPINDFSKTWNESTQTKSEEDYEVNNGSQKISKVSHIQGINSTVLFKRFYRWTIRHSHQPKRRRNIQLYMV